MAGPQPKKELLLSYLYFYVPADGSPSEAGEVTVTILVQELASCSSPHRGPGRKGKGQGIIQRKLLSVAQLLLGAGFSSHFLF